jgi:hypothetical protein
VKVEGVVKVEKAGQDGDSTAAMESKTADAADSAPTSAPAAAAAEEGEEYVNMFWLDAAENNGILYLFGKIPVSDPAVAGAAGGAGAGAGAGGNTKRFVSCCVVVSGSERNLFVLPRIVPDTFKEDGSAARKGAGEVYQELNSLLGNVRQNSSS